MIGEPGEETGRRSPATADFGAVAWPRKLSTKLLALTIVFVLIAEILIFIYEFPERTSGCCPHPGTYPAFERASVRVRRTKPEVFRCGIHQTS